jgi:hypothetical protein
MSDNKNDETKSRRSIGEVISTNRPRITTQTTVVTSKSGSKVVTTKQFGVGLKKKI